MTEFLEYLWSTYTSYQNKADKYKSTGNKDLEKLNQELADKYFGMYQETNAIVGKNNK